MNQGNIILFLMAAIILISLFAFAFMYFLGFSQRKIIGAELQVKQNEIEYQNRLLKTSIEAQEKERDKIARELHDAVSSKLNVALLNISQINGIASGTEREDTIKNIQTMLRDVSETARTISHELMPPMIKKYGLKYALEDLQDSINMSGKIEMTTKNIDFLDVHDENKIMHIFRIVQELVNNTLKYASASHIHLGIESEMNKIKLTYSDDGLGFEDSNVKLGMGMENIISRVKILNGEKEFRSELNKGMMAQVLLRNEYKNV